MKFKKVIDKLLKKDKWRLYLYFNGQLIAKRYIDEEFLPANNFYIVKLRGKKHLIGTNRPTQMVFRYDSYKLTDNDHKEVHIEVQVYEGVR